jgi:hypothetical protein
VCEKGQSEIKLRSDSPFVIVGMDPGRISNRERFEVEEIFQAEK